MILVKFIQMIFQIYIDTYTEHDDNNNDGGYSKRARIPKSRVFPSWKCMNQFLDGASHMNLKLVSDTIE